jgi:hypothetical protein
MITMKKIASDYLENLLLELEWFWLQTNKQECQNGN